jgi:hypothetical protein
MFNFMLLLQTEESLWLKIVTGIPHNPAAIFLYLVLVACGVVLWRAHRSSTE